jgi:glucokinase
MAVIGVDLGGTKISSALLFGADQITGHNKVYLNKAKGDEVGELIKTRIHFLLAEAGKTGETVTSVGVSVPGIYDATTGKVWAPNIPGWDNYPLLKKLQETFPSIHFYITNDRACYILGEVWKGKAKGCKDVIYIAVGTGLAAGIMTNGEVLYGSGGIAGAIGWLALNRPFEEKYIPVGCNEYYASGEGIARYAREVIAATPDYKGVFKSGKEPNSFNIIEEFDKNEEIAVAVMNNAIAYWGMSVANLVSIFNPEKIIFGGGVFSNNGSGFLDAVYAEALKWGQPISMKQVELTCSENGEMSGLYGAIYHAMESEKRKQRHG